MGRIAALDTKQLSCEVINNVLALENGKNYFPIQGFYSFLLCFKDGTSVRFIDNYRNKAKIRIYGNPNFDTAPLNLRNEIYGDYGKMKAPERKAFVEYLKSHQYEECKDDNGFSWLQECGADKTSVQMHFGGVQVNVLTRKQVIII